jgi:hypothetical protein
MAISAQSVVDRIRQELGTGWQDSPVDTFLAGSPADTRPPESGGAGGGPASMEDDPAYKVQRDYIAANRLVVYRLFDDWNARQPDPQLQGLAKALGWEKYYKPLGGLPWATGNGFFEIPPATLKQTAQNLKSTLKAKSLRVGGDPDIRVNKAALNDERRKLHLAHLRRRPGHAGNGALAKTDRHRSADQVHSDNR